VCFLIFVEPSNNKMMLRFLVSLLVLASCKESYKMAKAQYTLDSLRASLVREEDTIIFALIERARFPLNSPTYNQSYTSQLQGSLLQFIIRNTEAIHSKVPLLRLSLLIYSLLVLTLRLAICFCFDLMVCCRQVDTLILKKILSSQKIYHPRLCHITPSHR